MCVCVWVMYVHARRGTHVKRKCLVRLATKKSGGYNKSPSIRDGKMTAAADSTFINFLGFESLLLYYYCSYFFFGGGGLANSCDDKDGAFFGGDVTSMSTILGDSLTKLPALSSSFWRKIQKEFYDK